MEQVIFTVNGEECRISPKEMVPDMSLNTYLRTRLCLTGTKFMCQEGGCGCCIVMLQGKHPVTGDSFTLAINSCLFLVLSCHDLAVTTIEGLGSKARGYHEMQKRLAEHDGTQCGFCSPGFVMNMFSLYTGKFGSVTSAEIENAFGGNICRCTGYRPILDAWKSFATDAPPGLQEVCDDIEDLTLTKCPKSGRACFGNCQTPIHIRAAEEATWTKVYTLAQLLRALESSTSGKYRLVAGNTATGIYRMPYDIETFIDVSSVTELRTYTINDTIIMGGNVTITEWMTILQQAADRRSGYMYCLRVRDHIDHMATVPVRNVGTIAGNFMIKHDHPDFYSDPFLLLETVGATITIVDTTGNEVSVTPENFLSINMDKKVITKITMPQLDPNRYQLNTFKASDRAQNAQIFMNAGFLFDMNLSTGLVSSSRVVYGGINPSFVHASSIENTLNGNNLFNNSTIQAVIQKINSDFKFEQTLLTPLVSYRHQLTKGLFYKTVLKLASNGRIRPNYQSGAYSIQRPISSGKQIYQTIPVDYPITKPIEKLEAIFQCSGEAEYVNDMYFHNDLWAALVLSKDPFKIIKKIDATKALELPGVKAFYGADDIPGINSFVVQKGPLLPSYPDPEQLFCNGKVLYHGQPVGVIVAKEMSQAVHAAEFVEITYEDRISEDESTFASLLRYLKGEGVISQEKILPTLMDVLKEDPKLTEYRYQIPIVMKAAELQGIAQGNQNIRGYLLCGPQYHYHMECQTTIAVPRDDSMDIYPSTQWMDFTNMGVAQVLGVDNSFVNIQVRRVGGAFGGKISRSTMISAAAAVACYHTNRPIRLVLPMEINMRAIGKRTPSFSEYDVDFNNLGVIQKLTCDVTHDLGCHTNEPMDFFASLYTSNAYVTLTWTIIFHHVLTDAASNTWMRSPGATEVIAMAETVMEHIAWTLKKDPVDVRLANIAPVNPIRKIIKDFLVQCDYYNRRSVIEQFNQQNRWRKRGIGISLMQYPQLFGSSFETLVAIYHGDGSVVLNLGGIELGQGINTKCVQIAAATLKVPIEYIKIKPPNNVISANTASSAGNMATDAVGMSVKRCCETLNLRFAPIRLLNPLGSWEDIVQAAYVANIEMIAMHLFTPKDLPPYTIYGASCAEIEIDVLTGDFQLNRVDLVEDLGHSINPRIDVGQVEGAFITGMGYWLNEKLIYNRATGELLTDRSWNYKPPGAKDIPVDFRVTLLQTSSTAAGVVGSKACSEPAVSMAVVVITALRMAVNSARRDAGEPDSFVNFTTGTTKEDILVQCATRDQQLVL